MPGHPLFRILSAIQEGPWAITERMMETIMGIVETHVEGNVIDIEAVAAKLGRPLENARGAVEMRGDVAVIDVTGPIFRYADIFTRISGATAVESLATDFQQAIDNPQVRQIVLNIDSPGGQVGGIQELAQMVRKGAAQKPVTAYIDGLGASGAYWLAAAAGKIFATESAFVGSIGVVVSVNDNRAAQEKKGVKRYEIVSTKSPLKRTDVATAEGQAQLRVIADSLAEIFIANVAAYRGVSTQTVEQNYGQGGILIARQALSAGMIDGVTNFEALIEQLNAEEQQRFFAGPTASTKEVVKMEPTPLPATAPAAQAPPVAAAAPDPKARIRAILTCDEAKGREQLAHALALESDLDPEAAKKILAAAPVAVAAPAVPENTLATAMAKLPNPKVGVAADATLGDSVDADVASVLRWVPKDRRVA